MKGKFGFAVVFLKRDGVERFELRLACCIFQRCAGEDQPSGHGDLMEHAFHRHHHIEYRTCWAAHVNQDRATGSRIPFAQRIGKTMRPPPLRDLFRVSPCLPYQSSRCVEDAGDDEIGFAGGHFWQVVREALQGLFSALDGAVLLDDKVTIGWRVKDSAYSQPCLFAQVFESPYSHEVRAGPAFLSSA